MIELFKRRALSVMLLFFAVAGFTAGFRAHPAQAQIVFPPLPGGGGTCSDGTWATCRSCSGGFQNGSCIWVCSGAFSCSYLEPYHYCNAPIHGQRCFSWMF